jgi:transposase
MNRAALESLDKETLVTLVLAQSGSIAALTRQVAILTARVAELEARLGLPAKTPDNSSTPPSRGPSPRAGRPARQSAGRIRARTARCTPIRHRGAR